MKKKLVFLFLLFVVVTWKVYDFLCNFYHKIPLELDCYSGCPIVSVQIQENSYSLELDLGSKMPLSLQARALEKIQKEQQGVSRRLDFRGNKYETPIYIIPSASLHGLSVSKVKAQEEAYSFYSAVRFHDSTGRSDEEIAFRYFGRLGLGFFAERNFLLDCSRSWLILCRSLRDLRQEGYDIDRFISASFSLTPCGILLTIETDQGVMRLLVDTGATSTIIRSSYFKESIHHLNEDGFPTISTSKFVLNGTDFGAMDMLVMDMTPYIDEFMDGILGMDFLKDHPLFFDFKRKVFYVYV